MPLSPSHQRMFKKEQADVSYRHEAIVLGVHTDEKMKVKNKGRYGKDTGDVEAKYNPVFWSNLNLPPETIFYKKSVKEIESIFGVPIETQFRVINK